MSEGRDGVTHRWSCTTPAAAARMVDCSSHCCASWLKARCCSTLIPGDHRFGNGLCMPHSLMALRREDGEESKCRMNRMSEREAVAELPWAADCCPWVGKLRTVLPLIVGIRDSVVHLVSILGGVSSVSARAFARWHHCVGAACVYRVDSSGVG